MTDYRIEEHLSEKEQEKIEKQLFEKYQGFITGSAVAILGKYGSKILEQELFITLLTMIFARGYISKIEEEKYATK